MFPITWPLILTPIVTTTTAAPGGRAIFGRPVCTGALIAMELIKTRTACPKLANQPTGRRSVSDSRTWWSGMEMSCGAAEPFSFQMYCERGVPQPDLDPHALDLALGTDSSGTDGI